MMKPTKKPRATPALFNDPAAKLKVKKKVTQIVPKQPALRYNSHEAIRQNPGVNNQRYRPQLEYKVAMPQDKLIIRNKSELRKTPGSTKSKSASSGMERQINHPTEQNVLYFSKNGLPTEDTHLNTPLTNKNFAATLDPRDFNRVLELTDQRAAAKRSSGSLERVPHLDDQPIYNNFVKDQEAKLEAYKKAYPINSQQHDLRKMKTTPNSKSQQPPQNPAWYNSIKPRSNAKLLPKREDPVRNSDGQHMKQLVSLGHQYESASKLSPLRTQSGAHQQLGQLQASHQNMRNSVQKISVSLQSLQRVCSKLQESSPVAQLVDSLNNDLNLVQYNMLQSDDMINYLASNVGDIFHQNKYLQEYQDLSAKLSKLTDMHQTLQQNMYNSTLENKRLKAEIKKSQEQRNDQEYMNNYALENYDKMLADSRNNNAFLVKRIEDLQTQINQQQDGGRQELKWVSNAEKLMDQSSKFLSAMKKLQKALYQKEDGGESISNPKQQFEYNKKQLEKLIKETKLQLADANYEPSQKSDENLLLFLKQQEEQLQVQQNKIMELATQNEQLKSKPEVQNIGIQTKRWHSTELSVCLAVAEHLVRSIESPVNDLQHDNEQLLHQIKTQETALKNLREQNKTLNTQLEQFKGKKVDDLDLKLAKSEVEAMKAQVKKVAEERNKAQSEVAMTKTQVSKLEADLKLKQSEYNLLVSESDSKDTKLATLQSSFESLKEDMDKQDKEIEDLQADNNKLKLDLSETHSKVHQLKSNVSLLQTQVKEAQEIQVDHERAYARIAEEKDQLTQDKAGKQTKLVQKEEKIGQLQEQLEMKQKEMDELETKLQDQIREMEVETQKETEAAKTFHRLAFDDITEAKAALQTKFNELKGKYDSIKQQSNNEYGNKELESKLVQLQDSLQETESKLSRVIESKKELQTQNNQLYGDLNEAEQIRAKHQTTLEKNRDLISMLKEQLQKAVDKQKSQEGSSKDVKQQKIDLLQGEISKFKKEVEKYHSSNEVLKEQVVTLKQQFQEKMTLLSNKIDDLQAENQGKEDLINEANNAIEELQAEKHDVGAKLKHLTQVYVYNVARTEDQSSYKGDESSLSIGDCFGKIQVALEQGGLETRSAMPMQAQKANHLSQTLKFCEEMLNQNLQKLEHQKKLLETADRKVKNYKSTLAQKCAQLAESQQQIQAIKARSKEMEAKLAATEKQIESKQVQINDLELKINEPKLNSKTNSMLESNHSKSELVDQLEMENMELLAKLASTEKDLQELRKSHEELRNKQNEMSQSSVKIDQTMVESIQARIQDLHQKLYSAKGDVIDKLNQEFSEQVKAIKSKYSQAIEQHNQEGPQNLINSELKQVKKLKIYGQIFLAIQVLDGEDLIIKFVEEKNLDEETKKFVHSYSPTYFNERELPADIDDRAHMYDKAECPNKNIESFSAQIKELRQEQKELLKEFLDMRTNVLKQIEGEDQRDLQSLTDDVQFFSAENLELRIKIKALVLQNVEQKVRIEELRDRQALDISAISGDNKNNQDNINDQSPNLSELSQEKIDLFNESSIDQQRQYLDQISASDIEIKIANNGNQSLSIVGDATTPNRRDKTQNVTLLESELKEANLKIQTLMNELKQTAPNREPKVESLDKSQSSDGSNKNILEHVKGTLIMYLKKSPIIDLNNEMLLKIIYSMMHFTKDDIQRLQEAREELPVYKIDPTKTKQRQSSKREASQKNSSNQNSLSHDMDAEKTSQRSNGVQNRLSIGRGIESPKVAKEKVGRGIMGMFSKKESKNSHGSGSARPLSGMAFNYMGDENANSFRSRQSPKKSSALSFNDTEKIMGSAKGTNDKK